jgi:hypothetical protein
MRWLKGRNTTVAVTGVLWVVGKGKALAKEALPHPHHPLLYPDQQCPGVKVTSQGAWLLNSTENLRCVVSRSGLLGHTSEPPKLVVVSAAVVEQASAVSASTNSLSWMQAQPLLPWVVMYPAGRRLGLTHLEAGVGIEGLPAAVHDVVLCQLARRVWTFDPSSSTPDRLANICAPPSANTQLPRVCTHVAMCRDMRLDLYVLPSQLDTSVLLQLSAPDVTSITCTVTPSLQAPSGSFSDEDDTLSLKFLWFDSIFAPRSQPLAGTHPGRAIWDEALQLLWCEFGGTVVWPGDGLQFLTARIWHVQSFSAGVSAPRTSSTSAAVPFHTLHLVVDFFITLADKSTPFPVATKNLPVTFT